MQKECFFTELAFLQKETQDKNIPELVNQLDLFLDENKIIRSKGRISKTLLYSYDVLNPIMLGKNHQITNLIISELHAKCQHLGVHTIINFIRTNGFWIPHICQAVKNILTECITCKKFNSIPFRYPRMTNLPKDRVRFIRPFEHTGVDFTGHLNV